MDQEDKKIMRDLWARLRGTLQDTDVDNIDTDYTAVPEKRVLAAAEARLQRLFEELKQARTRSTNSRKEAEARSTQFAKPVQDIFDAYAHLRCRFMLTVERYGAGWQVELQARKVHGGGMWGRHPMDMILAEAQSGSAGVPIAEGTSEVLEKALAALLPRRKEAPAEPLGTVLRRTVLYVLFPPDVADVSAEKIPFQNIIRRSAELYDAGRGDEAIACLRSLHGNVMFDLEDAMVLGTFLDEHGPREPD